MIHTMQLVFLIQNSRTQEKSFGTENVEEFGLGRAGRGGIKPQPEASIAYCNYQVKGFYLARMALNVKLYRCDPAGPPGLSTPLTRRPIILVSSR